MNEFERLGDRFQPPRQRPLRMIREVTDGVWLNVDEISEVIISRGSEGTDLILVMRNGNKYIAPVRKDATPETMIRNLFTGGHE